MKKKKSGPGPHRIFSEGGRGGAENFSRANLQIDKEGGQGAHNLSRFALKFTKH